MRKLIPGYYPSFNYGGEVGLADEDDKVNGRPPYYTDQISNIASSFVEGRGAQLATTKFNRTTNIN